MADMRRYLFSRSTAQLVAVLAAVVALLYVVNAVSGGETEGFRLRADTMVPENGPIWPEDVRCPDRQATSPVEFSPASALAYELRVYDTELLFSQITLAPYQGAVPDQVTFQATWPEDSVAADSPLCAFLLADDVGTPSLSWRRISARTAEFVVENPRPHGPTTVEVWLQAVRPTSESAFGASLSTTAVSDSIVVEPLGGRISIDARPSATISAQLSTPVDRVDGRNVRVQVALPNPTADTIALSTEVEVSAGAGVTWSVSDESNGVTCATSSVARCQVGDIRGGESLTLVLDAVLPSDWEPSTDAECRAADGRLRVGLCVIADTINAGASAPVRTTLMIDAATPIDSPISGTLSPDPLIVRRGDLASVTYIISAVGNDDLGSVEVTGTDCLQLTRIPQALDDDDAFLEVGETWQFDCLLDAVASRTFRLDLAALSETAEPVSTSIDGVLTVINPAMDVTSKIDGEEMSLTVRNTGSDPLSSVSVVIPGCTEPPTTSEPTNALPVGSAITFSCGGFAPSLDDPIVYALDAGGQPISARPSRGATTRDG